MKGWKPLSLVNKPVKGNLIIVKDGKEVGEPLIVLDVQTIHNDELDEDLLNMGLNLQDFRSKDPVSPFGDVAFQVKVVGPSCGQVTMIIRHPTPTALFIGAKMKGNPPELAYEHVIVCEDDVWNFQVQA